MNCPNCKRLIYSRQHATCGYCGVALPESFVFSPEEVAALKAETREIDRGLAEMRAEDSRQQEEQRQAQASTSLFLMIPFMW